MYGEHLHVCVICALSRSLGLGVVSRSKLLRSEQTYRSTVTDCAAKTASFFSLESRVASCPSEFPPRHFFIDIKVAKPCCTLVERCLEDILCSMFFIGNSWLLDAEKQLLCCSRGSVYYRKQAGLSPADEQGQAESGRFALLHRSVSDAGCVPPWKRRGEDPAALQRGFVTGGKGLRASRENQNFW